MNERAGVTESRKQSMAILQRVSEFLGSLPDEHLADLESGAAQITVIPAGSTEPLRPVRSRAATTRTPKTSTLDLRPIAEAVRLAETRAAATALLTPLRKDPDLKDIAVRLNVTGLGNLPKPALIDAIVEATVGDRLDSLAIRGGATLPY